MSGLVKQHSGLVLDGQWTARAYAPCRVADPDEARAILKRVETPLAGLQLHRPGLDLLIPDDGVVPMSIVRVLLKHAGRAARRQLERLLEGGTLKWEDAWANIVVNVGLDHVLDVELSAAIQVTTWYLLLTDGTPTVAAGDTMASHAGWVEVTAYDEAVRQTWSDGGVSGQSVGNSASPATFTIDTNSTTVGGAALTSVNTKGGATGTLFAAGAFSAADKSLDDNDTLDVTATFTGADDGV